MKVSVWRKVLAVSAAMLIVSGYAPVNPAADLFAGMTITARAEEEKMSGQCGENACWIFDAESGELTISGEGAMYDYDIDVSTDIEPAPWYDFAKKSILLI